MDLNLFQFDRKAMEVSIGLLVRAGYLVLLLSPTKSIATHTHRHLLGILTDSMGAPLWNERMRHPKNQTGLPYVLVAMHRHLSYYRLSLLVATGFKISDPSFLRACFFYDV